MKGESTYLTNPEEPEEEPRKFTFDFSYWSHDGFEERDDGYLAPSKPNYADQVQHQDDYLGKKLIVYCKLPYSQSETIFTILISSDIKLLGLWPKNRHSLVSQYCLVVHQARQTTSHAWLILPDLPPKNTKHKQMGININYHYSPSLVWILPHLLVSTGTFLSFSLLSCPPPVILFSIPLSFCCWVIQSYPHSVSIVILKNTKMYWWTIWVTRCKGGGGGLNLVLA